MKETEIHAAFIAWLKKAKIPFIHSRTDRRTTTRIGDPDFVLLWQGRCLAIEVKVMGGKLRPEQLRRKDELEVARCTVKLCFSVEECIHATTLWLGSDTRPFFGDPSRPLDCQGISNGSKGKADVP